MVDSPCFDRVLSKVNMDSLCQLVFGLSAEKAGSCLYCCADIKTTLCFLQVDILSASPGKVVCEMRVEEEHTNRGGTLHGGLTATLVDVVSTMAIMYSERGAPGVSVDMNIT